MTEKIINNYTEWYKPNIHIGIGEDGKYYYSCKIHQTVGNFPEFQCQECENKNRVGRILER